MTNWLVPIDYSEGQMIDIVEIQIGAIAKKLTATSSREWLEATLQGQLQRGLIGMLQVIEWADAGDVIADVALRRLWAEMADRHEAPPVTLQAYAIKTMARGPINRGRGHHWYNDWRRRILASPLLSSLPARSSASTRAVTASSGGGSGHRRRRSCPRLWVATASTSPKSGWRTSGQTIGAA